MMKKVAVVIMLLLATVIAATVEDVGWEGALSSSTISMNKTTVVMFLATIVMVVLVALILLPGRRSRPGDHPTGVVGVGAMFVGVEFGCVPTYHFVRIK
jgi:hypothetical protein